MFSKEAKEDRKKFRKSGKEKTLIIRRINEIETYADGERSLGDGRALDLYRESIKRGYREHKTGGWGVFRVRYRGILEKRFNIEKKKLTFDDE